MEAEGRSNACKTRAARSLRFASTYQFSHFAPHLGERRVEHSAPRVHDDVPLRSDRRQFGPQGFAHTPANPVAFVCFSQCARRGESEARARGPRFVGRIQTEGREQARRETYAAVIDALEIGALQNTVCFGERARGRRYGGRLRVRFGQLTVRPWFRGQHVRR